MSDHLTARGPLFDGAQPGRRVGMAYLDCWVVRNFASGHGLYDCSYLLHMDAGNLTLEGIDPYGPGMSTFAVTGGTGAYRNARGEAVFFDTSDFTDMKIALSS